MNSMMQLPDGDVGEYRIRLARGERVTVLLREMAAKYGGNRSILGFFIADLVTEQDLMAVQLVWVWDLNQTGKGLTDEQLEDELRNSGVRFGPP